MLRLFRALSIAEGVSYLLILSISLGFVSRDYVSMVGMTHGILFLLYIMLSLPVAEKSHWSARTKAGVFLASVIPFAFIGVELYLRKSPIKSVTAVN